MGFPSGSSPSSPPAAGQERVELCGHLAGEGRVAVLSGAVGEHHMVTCGEKKRLGLRAGPHGHGEDLWAGGKRFAHAQLPLTPPIQACHGVGISHLLASSPINPKFTPHNPSLSSNPNHFVILIARLHPTNGTVRTRA